MPVRQDFGSLVWVTGRKRHRCELCYGRIPRGERHAQFKGMYEGYWQNWRMHEECYNSYDADGEWEFVPGDAPVPHRVAALTESHP